MPYTFDQSKTFIIILSQGLVVERIESIGYPDREVIDAAVRFDDGSWRKIHIGDQLDHGVVHYDQRQVCINMACS